MNILFLCTSNINRSKTAEHYFSIKYPYHSIGSAGLSKKYCSKHKSKLCTEDMLEQADWIYVMESLHLLRIQHYTQNKYTAKIINLDIEDIYSYMQKELIETLKMKVNLDDISKKVIYIDMDDTLCDYSGAHLSAKRLRPHIKFPQSEPGFFHELLPIPNAVKVMNLLLQSINYDPFILTAPSVMNPLCYTEKRTWVEQYLGMDYVNRLIISPRKELLIGDFLIDDYTHGKGQEFFKGEILHFGSDDIPDWSAIKSKLDL